MAEFSTDPNKSANPAAPSGSTPVPSENTANPVVNPPSDPPASIPAPQPPNPTPPPAPTTSENQGVGTAEGAISPPQNPAPAALTPDPTPDPAEPSGLGGPDPLSGAPSQTPTDTFSSQAPMPENTAVESAPLSTNPTPPLTSEEVGPPWMRTDPSVRASQDAVGASSTPDLTPGASEATETVPPWQQATPSVDVSNAEEPSQGHFPVIIFVILVLGIIVAIGVFLFTQGALPFS